jgi:hypothetical protein
MNIEKLKAGARQYKEIEWPGTDEKVLLKPITEKDKLDASNHVDSMYNANKNSVLAHNIDAYSEEKMTFTLWRCVLDVDTKKPITKTVAEFREILTQEVKYKLDDELNCYQEEVSPNFDLPEEEFKIKMNEIKKKPGLAWDLCNINLLRRLVVSMASQLSSVPKGN